MVYGVICQRGCLIVSVGTGLQGVLYADAGPSDATVDRSSGRQQSADDSHQSTHQQNVHDESARVHRRRRRSCLRAALRYHQPRRYNRRT